jgi:hypothetical protein
MIISNDGWNSLYIQYASLFGRAYTLGDQKLSSDVIKTAGLALRWITQREHRNSAIVSVIKEKINIF